MIGSRVCDAGGAAASWALAAGSKGLDWNLSRFLILGGLLTTKGRSASIAAAIAWSWELGFS